MESIDSLLRSQEPAMWPHPESDQSTVPFNIKLSVILISAPRSPFCNQPNNQPPNSTEHSLSWEGNIAQLIEKHTAIYGTWRFITVFTRAHHWSLSRNRWIQSTISHPISLRSILILSSYIRLDIHVIFSLRFSSWNFARISHISYACCMRRPSHSPGVYHRNNIWRRVKITKLFSMQFSLSFSYFSLTSEYSPKHTFLKLSQCMLFP
jgi:hypothetical protein